MGVSPQWAEAARVALRQGTLDYISMDPTDIALIPKVRIKTDAGTFTETDGPPKPIQTFKLISIEFTPQGQTTIRTDDGIERVIGFYLLGAWDCDMKVRDHWIGVDGRRYEIVALMDGHGYETKGAVEAHG